MRSDIFENTLKEMDQFFKEEFSLGLKLVHFDENDQEMEPEYRKLSFFPIPREE